jgi:hypothetical protein
MRIARDGPRATGRWRPPRGTARAERSDQRSSVKLDHAATLPGDHALMIALHKQRPESVVRLPADRTRELHCGGKPLAQGVIGVNRE